MSADVRSRLESVQEETRELTPVSSENFVLILCSLLAHNNLSEQTLKEMIGIGREI